VIRAVIGSGVLSLAWSMAQLGWVVGPVVIIGFSVVTYYTSLLLADCYRSPDPVTGQRNYTYKDAVKANLGKFLHLVSVNNIVGILSNLGKFLHLVSMNNIVGILLLACLVLTAVQAFFSFKIPASELMH